MKGHNEMFKCYTGSHILISSKQVPSEKTLFFLFQYGMKREASSFPAPLKDKGLTIINYQMQIRILYLSKFYVQHI